MKVTPRNAALLLVLLLSLHYYLQNYLQLHLLPHSTTHSLAHSEIQQLISEYEASFDHSSTPLPCSERVSDGVSGGERGSEGVSQKRPGVTPSLTHSLTPVVTFIVPSMFRMTLVDALESLLRQSHCHWEAIVVYQSPPLRHSLTHMKESQSLRRSLTHASNSTDTHTEESSRLLHHSHTHTLSQQPPEHLRILPLHQMSDERITFLESSAHAEVNFAGHMRNDALTHVRTEWVAFLDDDDTLLPHYITSLLYEASLTPQADVVLFRMLCHTCYTTVIPPLTHMNLVRSYTGISFAIKSKLLTHSPTREAVNDDLFIFPTGANEDYCLLYNIRNKGHTLVMSPIITYLVKGPHSTYLPILEWSSGGLQTGINRSVLIAPLGTYPDTCEQKQLPSTAVHTRNTIHGFSFPEQGHYIFQQNILGLTRALTRASDAGCVMSWLLQSVDIEIHFSYLTPVKKGRPYIQVQVEQIHSKRHMFTNAYVNKLKSALQVWTIAPSHYRFLQSYLQVKQTYFMPLWLTVDPDASMEHTCRTQALTKTLTKRAIVQRVRDHYPYSVESRSEMLEECVVMPIGTSSKDEGVVREYFSKKKKSKRKSKSAGVKDTLSLCPLPRVVMYGALTGSDDDRRLKLCATLKKELSYLSASMSDDATAAVNTSAPVSVVECFHGIYEASLDRVLCGADIVVVDRYYSTGAVESHRIDPLLQMGKVVVSTSSKDEEMQSLYEGVVQFATSVDGILEVVTQLLHDHARRKEIQRRGQEFMRQRVSVTHRHTHRISTLTHALILMLLTECLSLLLVSSLVMFVPSVELSRTSRSF